MVSRSLRVLLLTGNHYLMLRRYTEFQVTMVMFHRITNPMKNFGVESFADFIGCVLGLLTGTIVTLGGIIIIIGALVFVVKFFWNYF